MSALSTRVRGFTRSPGEVSRPGFRRGGLLALGLLAGVSMAFPRCSETDEGEARQAPASEAVTKPRYPAVAAPDRVGSYPALARAGTGYFYDEVLEYRVSYPDKDGGMEFRAFATYEAALAFSESTPSANLPVALVRQEEWLVKDNTGRYTADSGERITEWKVESLLSASKREAASIRTFLEGAR